MAAAAAVQASSVTSRIGTPRYGFSQMLRNETFPVPNCSICSAMTPGGLSGRGIVVDHDRHDVPVDDVCECVAAGDDVQLIPAALRDERLHRVAIAERSDGSRTLAGVHPHDVAAPADLRFRPRRVLHVADVVERIVEVDGRSR